MDWFAVCLYRYPRKYMTLAQLGRVLAMGLITQSQYDEVIGTQQTP